MIRILLALALALTNVSCARSLMEIPTSENSTVITHDSTDPYLWLEEIEGDRAIPWVENLNGVTESHLKENTEFTNIYNHALEVLESTDKIPYPMVRGEYVYNFWQDNDHVRGLWRRTKLESYKSTPKNSEIPWETLLDFDQLSHEDNESWVYKGATCVRPSYDRCLIFLSRGGKDATEVREFDLTSKKFVKDGFFLNEGKSHVSWLDRNTIFLGTDFGPKSMTKSGYPRISKMWKRGTPLSEAQTVFEGQEDDVHSSASVMFDGDTPYVLVSRTMTFYTSKNFWLHHGKLVPLPIPEDAEIVDIFKKYWIIRLRTDWKTHKSGSLVAMNQEGHVQTIYQPDEVSSLADIQTTKDFLIVNIFRNVQNEVRLYHLNHSKRWVMTRVSTPTMGSISVMGTDEKTNDFWFSYEGFLQPASLYVVETTKNRFIVTQKKSSPTFFDATGYEAHQHWSTSKDGTKIPYYTVHGKGIKRDGTNPTLLYGYGGFEISMDPYYLGSLGRNWLDRGGVFVLANIRGGGEFGPKWHQAALKQNRMRAFEDFISVAQNLIAQGVTTPAHLGIMGGSNGGLLVGATMVLRPDLFKAVVCQVPLLDMKRFHLLLAGNSWMAEYGNPDIPEELEALKKYSPYHNVKPGMTYPHVLFVTSTKDDRVHPGHARKMAARLLDVGSQVSLYENREGGHAGAADQKQTAYRKALEFTFLLEQLKGR